MSEAPPVIIDMKTPVTRAQLVGWGCMAVSGLFALSGVYYTITARLDKMEDKTVTLQTYIERLDKRGTDRMAISDRNNSDLKTTLAILPVMQLQIQQFVSDNAKLASKNEETNVRMDRIVDSFNSKIERSDGVQNSQSVKLGVMDEKLDNILRSLNDDRKPRPAILRTVR